MHIKLIHIIVRSNDTSSTQNSEGSSEDSAAKSQSRFSILQRGRGSRHQYKDSQGDLANGGRVQPSRGGRSRKGTKRGLRKPVEPSVEFKALHSQATMAYIAHEYDEAERLALQAILVNPEMFPAHSLLSEIHMARGNRVKALAALFHGAHTRPRDIQVWLKLAQWILDRVGNDNIHTIRDAIYCYSRVMAVDKNCAKARRKRAALYYESGQFTRAAGDYEYLLEQFPHDTTILRLFAEVYMNLDEVDSAILQYEESFRHYQLQEPEQVKSITWSDINIYSELYGLKKDYASGISRIKFLSRWLLGRGNDGLWEAIFYDDREWDSEDRPRRVQVPGFVPGRYEAPSYGTGLPLELRVRLGVYRLHLGNEHIEEAMVS